MLLKIFKKHFPLLYDISAQNIQWKLASHSFELGTPLYSINGSSLEMYIEMCPTKVGLVGHIRSYQSDHW